MKTIPVTETITTGELFRSLGNNLEELCLTKEQIESFKENDWRTLPVRRVVYLLFKEDHEVKVLEIINTFTTFTYVFSSREDIVLSTQGLFRYFVVVPDQKGNGRAYY